MKKNLTLTVCAVLAVVMFAANGYSQCSMSTKACSSTSTKVIDSDGGYEKHGSAEVNDEKSASGSEGSYAEKSDSGKSDSSE